MKTGEIRGALVTSNLMLLILSTIDATRIRFWINNDNEFNQLPLRVASQHINVEQTGDYLILFEIFSIVRCLELLACSTECVTYMSLQSQIEHFLGIRFQENILISFFL